MQQEPETTSIRTFMVLWAGQAVSLVGSQAVQFALIWWLTREAGSATVLATATLVGLGPQVLLGPIAGALVDRWPRKRVMLIADGAVAAAALALAAAFAAGAARIETIYALLLVRSIGATFHGPALVAATSLMVPARHLTRIQGLNQGLQGGLSIVAAPIGGALLAILPMAGILLVDVGTAIVAVATLALVPVPEPRRSTETTAGSAVAKLIAEIHSGFRYLAERSGHLSLVLLAAGTNLFLVPAFALLPLFVLEALDGSALQLAGMTSVFGIGMLAGGILLAVWGGFRRRIVTSLSALIVFGGATLALGLAPGVVWATVAMGAVGLLVPLVNGPIQAVLQATVAPEYQGRVFTLIGSLAGLAVPLGLLAAAPVAELAGVRAWYVAGAVACAAMGGAGFLVRGILQIETARPGATAGPAGGAEEPGGAAGV